MEACFNIGNFAKNSLSAQACNLLQYQYTFAYILPFQILIEKGGFVLGLYQYLLLYK